MSDEIRILLLAFATYRIAELISVDEGPYDIFERIRSFFKVRAMASGKQSGFMMNVAKLLECPFCVGIWISIAAGFVYLWYNPVADFITIIFAIAGIQAFLENIGISREKI